MVISIVLAILTYEFVEKKFSSRSFKPVSRLLFFNFILGVAGYLIFLNNGIPQRYPRHEELLFSKESFKKSIKPFRKAGFCQEKFNNIEICYIEEEIRSPTVALIGDSHANHWFPGISEQLDDRENLLLLAKSGTPPILDVKSKRNPDTDLDDEIKYILSTNSIHTVILSAFWSNYFEEKGTFVSGNFYKNSIYSPSLKSSDQNDIFKQQFEKMIKVLLASNKRVIFFYDIPSLDFDLNSCLVRPLLKQHNTCIYDVSHELEKQKGYRSIIEPLIFKFKILSFDPLNLICNSNDCLIKKNNNFIFSDSHHLSIWGSKELSKKLKLGI